MPVTDAIHKADRLEEIKVLFLRRPEGVGTREIAQLLRVSQRTARRYVVELSEKGRLPVYREGRVWKLVQEGQIDLRRIQLNLDEALALFREGGLSGAGVGLAGSGEARGRRGRAVYADFFGQPRFRNEALD